MSDFIPGPWLIAGDGRFVYALNDRGVNAFSAHVQDAHTNDDDLKATATLIHAAPDMLDVLEASVMDLEFAVALAGRDHEMRANAISIRLCSVRAAIAKALGENA